MKVDFVVKARAAWGAALPKWVEALAEQANRTSLRAVAQRIKYSPAVVSLVLNSAYKGDMRKVEGKVRGAYLNETVMCPVLGEIGRDRCLEEQAMPNTGASSIRARVYWACRRGCPHSRIKVQGET